VSDTPPTLPTGELTPGARLGRYRVVRLIAQGGMANVYEATHLDLQKRVALKAMLPELTMRPGMVQRFILEARAASRLTHPHVIGITDVSVEDGVAFMVMDYLDGEDLGTRAARDGAFDPAPLIDIMLPVISAVSAAHVERILHRDLKPENIFLKKRPGGREHPVLLDFGLSKSLATSARKITAIGEMLGTPSYMAPEQVEGAPVDERTDQYALGATIYRCVTGVLPFHGDVLAVLLAAILRGGARRPSEIVRHVTSGLDAIILRALAVNPADRYATMNELGCALWPLASPASRMQWAEEFGSASLSPSFPPPPRRDDAEVADAQLRSTASAVVAPNAVVTIEDVRRFAAFAEAEDAELEELLAATEPINFSRGRTIIRQGAHGHGCYFLVSGVVRIVRAADPTAAVSVTPSPTSTAATPSTPPRTSEAPTSSGAHTSSGSSSWVMGELGAGATFGQIALVDNVPRTASVIATTDVVALFISRSQFERLLCSAAPAAHRLREHVVLSGIRQLRRATQHFRVLSARREGQPLSMRDLAFVRVAAHEWGLPLPD